MNSGEWCPCVNKTPSPTHTDLTTTQPESSTDGGKEEVMYPQIPHIHTPNPYRQDTQTPSHHTIYRSPIRTARQPQTKSQTARQPQTCMDTFTHTHMNLQIDKQSLQSLSHTDRGSRPTQKVYSRTRLPGVRGGVC